MIKLVCESITHTSRVPVEGKSSVCAISMKYRKIILIVIIIRLGQILLSYIVNTSRTHAHTHTRIHSRTHTHQSTTIAIQVVAARGVGAPNHDEVDAPFSPVPLAMNGCSVLHYNK